MHNDYEQKFIVGRKEYQPQQPINKIDQIYAEVQDNKMQGAAIDNDEQFQEEQKENLNENENLNEDNGGNQQYEEENQEEQMDYNQQQMQSENMQDTPGDNSILYSSLSGKIRNMREERICNVRSQQGLLPPMKRTAPSPGCTARSPFSRRRQ